MSGAQWFIVGCSIGVGLMAAAGIAYLLATEHLRDIYDQLDIPWTDDEIEQSLTIANEDRQTPIYDRLVCDAIERAEGWTA